MTVDKDPIELFAKSVTDTIMKIKNDNKAYNEIMLKADEIEKLEKKLDKLYKEQRQRLSKEMISKNDLAEKICGLRDNPEGSLSIDFPIDFGYICPKCKSESLEWSEYNTFCWCPVCNQDFPTCICAPGLDKAIDIYLSSIESIKKGEL